MKLQTQITSDLKLKRIISGCLLLSTLIVSNVNAVSFISADLEDHLKSYDYGTKADNRWVTPNDDELHQFNQTFNAFYQQNWSLASEHATSINYEVIEFQDSATSNTYFLLQEKYPISHPEFKGGGTYIINPNGINAVLQAPHPKRDSFTATQAIESFLHTQSRLLMLAGTRRDSSHQLSECTNTHYAASDVAHQTQSYFQAAHANASDLDTESVFIQYHGFGSSTRAKLQSQCGTDNDLMLNLSEGVKYTTPNDEHSLLHLLRENVEAGGNIRACVYGNDTTSLGGTWNTQGRHSNGSTNNCHTNAKSSSKRFIHLEQSYGVRKNHRDEMAESLKKALTQYFN